ncbi:MAG TPA: hypothetical protein VFX51_22360 [Solirubrobacteraceae bacterium]|nr:hypothetical protein [Solirubrobacteraceae bacterium]
MTLSTRATLPGRRLVQQIEPLGDRRRLDAAADVELGEDGELFGDAVELTFTRGLNPWRFASPRRLRTFMETSYGPLVKARERLQAERRWEHCRAEILAMVRLRPATAGPAARTSPRPGARPGR